MKNRINLEYNVLKMVSIHAVTTIKLRPELQVGVSQAWGRLWGGRVYDALQASACK